MSLNRQITSYNIYGSKVRHEDLYSRSDRELLEKCTLCPRGCGVNRFGSNLGYCGTDAGLNISSICVHRGEEPSISGANGICNIFFTGCNLHCVYCQNHEISYKKSEVGNSKYKFEEVLDKIESILKDGVTSVGFVSPSHVLPQVKVIINGLRKRNLKPIYVYNTNSYEKPETLRSLTDLIDVYLADYKYYTQELASSFSESQNYPEVAIKAIKEMYYQKGSSLRLNENGIAENGMVIRHLVLPGHVEESKNVLRSIADELSFGVHISLMSQYYPTYKVKNHTILNRSLYKEEYEEVVKEMESLGFRNGWVQELESNLNYVPDFGKEEPFK